MLAPEPRPTPDSLDTAQTLAAFLSCSVALVRKLSRQPDFPLIRLGHATRFSRDTVLAWLQERSQKKQPVRVSPANGVEAADDANR